MSGDNSDYYSGRKQRNDKSKEWADNDKRPWSSREDDYIMDEWIAFDNFPSDRDEEAISKFLRRTIESCRNRAQHLRQQHGLDRPTVVQFRPKNKDTYIGADDDPEEVWWR